MSQRPEFIPAALCAILLSANLYFTDSSFRDALPATIFTLQTSMSFEGQDEIFYVSTYLPETDERQSVLALEVDAGKLALSYQKSDPNIQGRWTATSNSDRVSVGYLARIAAKGIQYEIAPDINLPIGVLSEQSEFLQETPAVQVHHPEIKALWEQIKPEASNNLLETLRAIHNYVTHEMEGAEFKGYTDALTALRLQQASCNGKSRLFVALARLNGLPARLVGGLILSPGTKKTSHQWVEILVADKWVPFDPTNDYFAEIPSHYVSLYKGDQALFTHTRNINFDHQFRIDSNRVSGHQVESATSPMDSKSWLVALFTSMNIDLEIAGTFLLFPVAALAITVCRNVIGLSSFGVFLPMLVGAVCSHTGLIVGVGGFLLILGLATVIRILMDGMKLLHVPRLSALITIVTSLIIFLIWLFEGKIDLGVTALVLFPVIILSFSAERMSDVIENSSFREGLILIASTLVIVAVCYLVMSSKLLEGTFLNYPELLLVVLSLQIMLGRWSGLRVSEFVRFHRIFPTEHSSEAQVLGINRRNRRLVDKINSPKEMATADNKVLSKGILANHRIPVPKTLLIIESYWDLRSAEELLPMWNSFVIKPGKGSQGKGILVIHGRDGEDFVLADGNRLTGAQLAEHMREILSGVYSQATDRDVVLVEAVVKSTAFYSRFTTEGLPDIRVILVDGELLAAMLRIPTHESAGKANLHQGAIGVPVDLDSGVTGPGYLKGALVQVHPESGTEFEGLNVPNWERIISVAKAAQSAIKLGYIGVDIADDIENGPLVIEVNARPGLEIQNVHGFGFGDLVDALLEKADQKEQWPSAI